ncbi:hypothetical protein IFM89_015393 [Coptis chinensis]|uniref:Uncharacterized protein n=1 Tax=Coptis chinensis TaxID=261450 RepID=A0A835IWS6_9MAGN|nr:hypothetical protein IFM89_015393 [Coptis chinensis]
MLVNEKENYFVCKKEERTEKKKGCWDLNEFGSGYRMLVRNPLARSLIRGLFNRGPKCIVSKSYLELIGDLGVKTISSLDLSLKFVSAFNGLRYPPTLDCNPKLNNASVTPQNKRSFVPAQPSFSTLEQQLVAPEKEPFYKIRRCDSQESQIPSFSPSSTASGSLISEEEDGMKALEAMLSKKSFREQENSKIGEELLDLINRPTYNETTVAAKFKSEEGSQIKEHCTYLTKEDCRRQQYGLYAPCMKLHYRRIISQHTDISLGDCPFLRTCRRMIMCKYIHYELDDEPTQDVLAMRMGFEAFSQSKPIKPRRAEYCSEMELGQPQWINCDIRSFKMDILGKFGVIMADPPWDIHMDLPEQWLMKR